MQAADLIALATAHGIDLSHVGGSGNKTDGDAKPRKRTKREVELGIEVPQTARGVGSRIYRRPQWSVAEMGQAAKDVPRIPWLAARYSYAGDVGGYWELWHALALEAHKLSRNDYWEPRLRNVKGEPEYYQGKLSALVLDYEMHQRVFVDAPSLFAAYMNVTPQVWDGKLSSRYSDLQGRYQRWLDVARGIIQRWLAADEAQVTS